MAHDTALNVMSGGDSIVTYDLTTAGAYPTTGKVPSGVLFVSATSATAPGPVTATNGLYVQPGTATSWTVAGTVTANAGTNLNTSLLALESGGNLATIAGKDFATQTTLSTLNGKVTACDTGAVVISSGAVTANAGTNLNTSLLALEAGGNLATIAGKDFATQTTLSTLNGKVTACNTGAVVVSSGAVTANAGTNLNTSLLALETGGNLATIAGKDFATQTTLSTLNGKVTACDTGAVVVSSGTVTVQQSTASNLKVDLSGTAANSTAIKVDGSAVTQPVRQVAATTGGYTPNKLISAATTNATSIKAAAGTLGAFHGVNNSTTTWCYVKFYNTASTPTAGSGTPVLVIGLPPGGGANMASPAAFSTGIGFTITAAAADNDTTAVAAGQVVISVWTF